MDTYSDEEFGELKYLAELYRKIGYTCIGITAKTGKNVDKVKELMQDKVSVFSGHSGTGKTTLVNAIEPGLDLKTAEISEQHLQGQHTTTFAEMFDLSFGGQIIDTPGIRGFGVVEIERSEEHTSELQSRPHIVCRLLLEKKNKNGYTFYFIDSMALLAEAGRTQSYSRESKSAAPDACRRRRLVHALYLNMDRSAENGSTS